MQNLLSKLDPILKLFFFLGIITIFIINFSLSKKLKLLENSIENSPLNRLINLQQPMATGDGQEAASVSIIEGCGVECQEKIREEVAKAIESLTSEIPIPTPTKVVASAPPQVKLTSKQTAYIPLSASFSTTSTSWVDVGSASAWVDLKNDYGGGATVSYDASIRTESGSGKVFVRLYDATNAIAVLSSELETTSAASSLLSSGNLAFWAGRNLYRVQIKSLDSSKVVIDGARIKVTY